MAKKKKIAISVRTQLLIVTSVVLLLVLAALVIRWLDSSMVASVKSPNHSYSDVTISGESVCLPHRDSTGPQTMECALGIQTKSGAFYAVTGSDTWSTQQRVQVTGTLIPATGNENYDIDATIDVTKV